jgi:hypothetical protein
METPGVSLRQALEKFEALVVAVDAGNQGYTHYLRCLLEAHLKEALTDGYTPKKAIVVVLQCPKRDIVGFAHEDEKCHTDTGRWMEIVLYTFLKGILSNIF